MPSSREHFLMLVVISAAFMLMLEETDGKVLCLPSVQYACKDGFQCLPSTWYCDGEVECKDFSDEDNCGIKLCADNEFQCVTSGVCISSDWLCDGQQDCSDNSDEEAGCPDQSVTCGPNHWKCPNSDTCIHGSQLCNVEPDCPSAADEPITCVLDEAEPCTGDGPCCRNVFQRDAFCWCNNGLKLNKSNNVCEDINECSEDMCEQTCTNSRGSYACSCVEDNGFVSDDDGHCIVSGPDVPALVFTNLASIQSLSTRDVSETPTVLLATNGVVSMDINVRSQKICWIVYGQREHELKCLHTETNTSTTINLHIDLKSINNFAIDWVTDNFYFVDKLDRIIVCNATGELCLTIIDTDISRPQGLALDPVNGKMFFSDKGQGAGPGQSAGIWRALMDGTNQTKIITKKLLDPRSIAVDPLSMRIYWYDSLLEVIESASYDGTTNRKVLARDVKRVDQITVFEQYLYASMWGEDSQILRMNRFAPEEEGLVAIAVNMTRPGAIRINHETAQPQGLSDRCQRDGRKKCSDLCLLAGRDNSTCRCQLGMTYEPDYGNCTWKKPTEPFLLYGQGVPGSVHGIPLNKEDSHIESMKPITGLDSPRAVDFYAEEDYVYYSDSARYTIGRQKLDGSGNETVLEGMIAKCEGIAVDWMGRNLFWTDDGLRIISVARLDGTKRKILINDGHNHPRDIEVDPQHGFMYWSDWAESRYSPNKGKIKRAHMDGTNITDLHTDLLWPNGLSLDVERQRLYWCDAYHDKIEVMSLVDGTNQIILEADGSSNLQPRHPFGIAVYGDTIFWSEYRLRSIYKYEDGTVTLLKQGGLMFEIKVYSSDSIQTGSNLCSEDNGGCEDLCLSLPGNTIACHCEDGKTLVNVTRCVADPDYMEFTRCLEEQFQCKNGRCINRQWHCDGENDCGDNSDEDEDECDDTTAPTCGPNLFACSTSKRCISMDWLCDGDDDCGDNTDETHPDCTERKCDGEDDFSCDNGKCIALSWKCDGDDDCGDMSDEPEDCDSPECTLGLFTCATGQCISELWRCDGENDCGDLSDEEGCGDPSCSEVTHFRCKSNRTTCIPRSRVCDGADDCPDGSDDSNNPRCSTVCSDGFWSCGDGICIPRIALCNGQEDCSNGIDERDCGECSSNMYRCLDGSCIPSERLCDYDVDCPGGEDESNCKCSSNMYRCLDGSCIATESLCDHVVDCPSGEDELNCKFKPCPRQHYQCLNSTKCIPYNKLCEGLEETDCPLEDDERNPDNSTNYCDVSCDAGNDKVLMEENSCEQCYQSPTGPLCSCPQGKILTGNLTCVVDRNVCRQEGICDQECVSMYDPHTRQGSYQCKCYPGYVKEGDRCKYNGTEEPYIIFSNRNQIRRLNLRNHESNILVFSLRNCIALDFDYKNSHIYWTDVAEDKIYRGTVDHDSMNAGLRNVTTVIQSGLGSSEGLAVDWIGQNLYWVESILDQIEVANLKGTFRKTLIAEDIEKPRDIVLDPRDGLMFWSDWEETQPRIERATMAGMNRTVIFNVSDISGGWPNGLTLDYSQRRLFWIDAKSDTIHSSDYRGHHTWLVLSESPRMVHPFSITVFEDKVYWTDWRNIGVHSANKWTGEDDVVVEKLAMHPFGIHVYHPTKQPQVPNPCADNNCSHLCLLNSSTTYVCACPHLMELDDDQQTCSKLSSFLVFAQNVAIRGVDLINMTYNVIPALTSPKVDEVSSVDHDVIDGHIYWTDTQKGILGRVNITTFKMELIQQGLRNVSQVAVDWVSRNIYWVDRRSQGTSLHVARLDGSYQMQINITLTPQFHRLVLDPTHGYMYWLNKKDEESEPSIQRACMDGSGVETLITTAQGLEDPQDLTIDLESSMLYWTDNRESSPGIYSWPVGDSDGQPTAPSNIMNSTYKLQALALYGGMIFYSENSNKTIRSFNIRDPSRDEIKRTKVGRVQGMFVYDKDSRTGDHNSCTENNGGCSQICLPTPDGFTCACAAGYNIVGGTECNGVDKFILYSTLSSIEGISASVDNQDSQLTSITGQEQVMAVDFHAVEDMIYWVDTSQQAIYRIKRDHTGKKAVLTTGLGRVESIAIDPVAGNIYWADQRTRTIGVARIGVWDPYVVVPKGDNIAQSIAVHPNKGYLFWTTVSSTERTIWRSLLNGSEPIVIASGIPEAVRGIAVDTTDHKLYLCHEREIVSMDLDGTNNGTFFPGNATTSISSLTVTEDYVYWIDNGLSGAVYRKAKNDLAMTVTVLRQGLKNNEQEALTDIIIYDSSQGSEINDCSTENGGCEQLCFWLGDRKQCACAIGKLDSDEVSCADYDVYVLYSERKSIQRFPVGQSHQDKIQPLTDVDNVIGIAPVFSRNGTFFTDIHNGSLLYQSLTNDSQRKTVLAGIGSVEGIAFNHLTDELFWTSYSNSTISRMKVFRSGQPQVPQTVVQMSSDDHPRGIALDVCSGDVFWTNWNTFYPSIMKSTMAGTNVQRIIKTGIRTPNGITVDVVPGKLYWCDARLDKIERANLDGSNRVVILDSEPVHPFGVAIHGNYLYWTDWVLRAVLRINKYTGGNKTEMRYGLQTQPMGIAVFTEPDQCEDKPCALHNGGCQGGCTTDEYGAISCSCPGGQRLGPEGQRCLVESTLPDPPCEEFTCQNGQCIPYAQTCDGSQDCEDDSDESEDYCYTRHCRGGFFACTREDNPDAIYCLPDPVRCNGLVNCPDGTDEENCADCSTLNDRTIKCSNRDVCIANSSLCDGVDDCGDNSDEAGCEEACKEGDSFYRCIESDYCIPLSWKCDGERDCPQEEDEQGCAIECKDYETQCADVSQCILKHWKCDGDIDCPDGSDEQDCGSQTSCSPDQFQCAESGKCIPLTWKCDHDNDCTDHSDEHECSAARCDDEREFACLNGQCIRQVWVCDHDNDCMDGSDEPDTCVYQPCNPTEFQCRSGQCVAEDYKCDGQADCHDESDEDGCNDCSEEQFKCADETCIDKSLRCDGTFHCDDTSDELDCDYSRCAVDLPCSQVCVDNPATAKKYECSCMEGFTLIEGSSCLLEHEEKPFLVFSIRHHISRINLDGHDKREILRGLNNAISVDFHWEAKHIYWSDIERLSGREAVTKIKRISFSTTDDPEAVDATPPQGELIHSTGIRNGDGIAVDWVGGNLYWADKGLNVIEVSKLNGSFRSPLITEDLEEPRALALHPRLGVFYWTDWGSNPYIGKAGMDGSNQLKLVENLLLWPNGLTIDYSTDRVFWADAGMDKIEFVEFDGTNRHTVYHDSEMKPHIFSLSLFGDSVFWADWQTKTIMKSHKYYKNESEPLLQTAQRPMDLHVVHPLRQLPVDNSPCEDNGGCSHLCLLREGGGRTCACPTSMALVQPHNVTCITTCPPLSFPCRSNKCIPSWWVCDQQDDCGDNSDEDDELCRSISHKCEKGMFQCKDYATTQKCIPQVLVCDMENDCDDGSDEKAQLCSAWSHCLPGYWSCGENEECILITQRCDHTPHCSNGADEENCDSCSEDSVKCDGIEDCPDGSDEQGCATACTGESCDDGNTCIDESWRCDFEPDCKDGTDEIRCPPKDCPAERFDCHINNECIPQQWVCDGEFDCQNHLDEGNCSDATCGEGEFPCSQAEGDCIPLSLRCDGEPNCFNNKDEEDCGDVTCVSGNFKCVSTSQCIISAWRCDGDRDCYDGSDEENCPGATCKEDEFKCNDTECVPHRFRCDGDRDCTDGSDERDCDAQPCRDHQCDYGLGCISKTMVCDGFDQCGDKRSRETSSDEANCPPTHPLVDCVLGTFRCGTSSACIEWERVCDRQQDCPEGEDEEYCFIGMTCESDGDFCPGFCNNTHSGGLVCHCEDGFKLSRNGRNCIDINECATFGNCPYECKNLNGSYHCSCPDNYYHVYSYHSSSKGEVVCNPYGSPPFILVADESVLKRVYPSQGRRSPASLVFAARTYSVQERLDNARVDSVDVNIADSSAYILTASSKTLKKVDIDSSYDRGRILWIGKRSIDEAKDKDDIVVEAMVEPKHIAIDWVTQNIYWTDPSLGNIGVLDPTSGESVVLFDDPLDDPYAIKLNPVQGKLYFTTLRNSSIYTASMDGANKTRLPINDLIWPTGLAVDLQADRLYWADPKARYIGTSDLNGGDIRKVKIFPRGVAPAFTIDVFGSQIYGTTYLENEIFYMNKFNRTGPRSSFTVVMRGLARPSDLIVFQSQKQLKGEDTCAGSPCGEDELCLLASNHQHTCKQCQVVDGTHQCVKTDGPKVICDLNCQNGGQCELHGREESCNCPDSYSGNLCQKVFCKTGMCQNGGTKRGNKCLCSPGYSGDCCQFKENDRCTDYCENGGSCTINSKDQKPQCQCGDDYYGQTCNQPCPCRKEDTDCLANSCKSYDGVDKQPQTHQIPLLPIIIIAVILLSVILVVACFVHRRRRRTAGFRHTRIEFDDDTEDIKIGNPSFGARFQEEDEDDDDMDLPFQNDNAPPAKIVKPKKKKKRRNPPVARNASEEDRVEAIDEGYYDEKTAILS